MLPEGLWLLISAALVCAQSRQSLSAESLLGFRAGRTFTLPPSANLTVSVAVCASGTAPRFFVTNASAAADDPGPGGGADVYEMALADGYASFNGPFADGGVLSVDDGGKVAYEVGVSESGPVHERIAELPYFGDTTNNQAIIFSPPVFGIETESPTYPNYTLPAANASLPDTPSISSNVSIVISKTSSTTTLLSGCALQAADSVGKVNEQRLWPKDEAGWRMQWMLQGLAPSTNYTAYVVLADTKVSGPLYFVTKSGSFDCPLLSQLPYCPGIAYAVPLPQPVAPFSAYNDTNLPPAISAPIVGYLTNFTTTLTTYACGRDDYSPLVSCDDCQREYRKWLCAVSFPRCSEDTSSSSSSSSTTSSSSSPTGTDQAQRVFSALQSQPTTATPRNANFPPFNQTYTALLPCLERCTAVDRACPAFLGFRCPTARFNAAQSYGVGYVDSAGEEGEVGEDEGEGRGRAGVSQDRWGNVWCNS